jgi:hypothetical protein
MTWLSDGYAWLAAIDVLCLVAITAIVARLWRAVRVAHVRIEGLAERLQYPIEQVDRLTQTFQAVVGEELQAAADRIEARLDPTQIKKGKRP